MIKCGPNFCVKKIDKLKLKFLREKKCSLNFCYFDLWLFLVIIGQNCSLNYQFCSSSFFFPNFSAKRYRGVNFYENGSVRLVAKSLNEELLLSKSYVFLTYYRDSRQNYLKKTVLRKYYLKNTFKFRTFHKLSCQTIVSRLLFFYY